MARGYMSGLILGSVIAVSGVAVFSALTPLPETPRATTSDPVAADPGAAPASALDLTASRDAQTPSVTNPTPDAPVSDTLSDLEEADTAPAAVPSVGTAAPLSEAQVPETDAPRVSVQPAAPTAPAGVADVPQAPAQAEDLRISTEPAQPTPPPVVEESSGFAADGDASDGDAPPSAAASGQVTDVSPSADVEGETAAEGRAIETAAIPDAEAAGDTGAEATAGTAVPDAEPVDETAVTEPEETVEAQTEEPATEEAAGDAPAATPAPTDVTDTGRAPGSASDGETAPRIAALPRVGGGDANMDDDGSAADGAAPATPPTATIGQRARPLTDRGAPVAEDNTAQSDGTGSAEPDPDLPPIARYAAPFSNPDDKPLMSIVLIDDAASIGAEALATFPYPLSFAVDPDDPAAAEKMERHRAAGFEVLALMDLPREATAQDAETALEVGFAALPEVVGVMEGVDAGVQGNRGLSDQMTAILRDKGYGFVTQNVGLNTVQKLAARQGVPSGFVFRDFDGAGQTPTVMRRFLDQAAFRAGQEGGVIMLGRVRPDTISALLLWGLQDRASRVALVPVTAVITQGADGG